MSGKRDLKEGVKLAKTVEIIRVIQDTLNSMLFWCIAIVFSTFTATSTIEDVIAKSNQVRELIRILSDSPIQKDGKGFGKRLETTRIDSGNLSFPSSNISQGLEQSGTKRTMTLAADDHFDKSVRNEEPADSAASQAAYFPQDSSQSIGHDGRRFNHKNLNSLGDVSLHQTDFSMRKDDKLKLGRFHHYHIRPEDITMSSSVGQKSDEVPDEQNEDVEGQNEEMEENYDQTERVPENEYYEMDEEMVEVPEEEYYMERLEETEREKHDPIDEETEDEAERDEEDVENELEKEEPEVEEEEVEAEFEDEPEEGEDNDDSRHAINKQGHNDESNHSIQKEFGNLSAIQDDEAKNEGNNPLHGNLRGSSSVPRTSTPLNVSSSRGEKVLHRNENVIVQPSAVNSFFKLNNFHPKSSLAHLTGRLQYIHDTMFRPKIAAMNKSELESYLKSMVKPALSSGWKIFSQALSKITGGSTVMSGVYQTWADNHPKEQAGLTKVLATELILIQREMKFVYNLKNQKAQKPVTPSMMIEEAIDEQINEDFAMFTKKDISVIEKQLEFAKDDDAATKFVLTVFGREYQYITDWIQKQPNKEQIFEETAKDIIVKLLQRVKQK
jgi:hypothetical protein